MPYPVRNLIEGRGEPVCVHPEDSTQKALSLMLEYEFSQLPVWDAGKHPVGMVTPGSILRALNNFNLTVDALCVADAMLKAHKYRLDDDLFDLLDRLKEANAILIVDGEDKLLGIVTTYDSTEYFRRRAEDLMLVEDIEMMVKELVLRAFTDANGNVDENALTQTVESITSSHDKLLSRYKNALRLYLQYQGQDEPKLEPEWVERSFAPLDPKEPSKTFGDLTLYEYTELLVHKDRWKSYAQFFNFGREAVKKVLDNVRRTRNVLAHFKNEVSAEQRDQLRFCADWLALSCKGASINQIAFPEPLTSVVSTIQDAVVMETEEKEVIASVEEVLGPQDSRYVLLAVWLQGQPAHRDRVTLTFSDIETIIKGELPPSARQHRAWWANDSVGHVQSKQWLEAGWRVAQINVTEERVTFVRVKGREHDYIRFFGALQELIQKRGDFPLRMVSPDGQSWQTLATLPEPGPHCLYFLASFVWGQRFRIELYIDARDQAQNKTIFDRLYAESAVYEEAAGMEISWERLFEKRASRVAIYHPGAITDDEKALQKLRLWATDLLPRFYQGFAEPAERALHEVVNG